MESKHKALSLIQFSAPVNLDGHSFPVTQWVQKRGVEQAWLEDGFVKIGPDRFPLNGGLVAHYRLARAALAPHKASGSEPAQNAPGSAFSSPGV